MGVHVTAPTVKAPVVGSVKKTYLYIGGAALAGIVFFAYIGRGRSSAPAGIDPATTSIPDPTMPTQVTTTVPNTEGVISTNAQWTQKAVEFLSSVGVEPQFAAQTLGKYLGRLALTTAEQAVVLTARAAIGEPPSGGPYPILTSPVVVPTPSPTTALPTPVLHIGNVGPKFVTLSWTAIPNAANYRVFRNGTHIDTRPTTSLQVARRTGVYFVTAVPKSSAYTSSAPSNHVQVV